MAALDLVATTLDSEVAAIASQNVVNTMDLAYVFDTGYSKNAIPKSMLSNDKPHRFTNLTSSNGEASAIPVHHATMPRLTAGEQRRK